MTTPCALRLAKLSAALISVAVAVAVAAPGVALAETPASLFYERSLMDKAGARCHLFSPEIGAALTAAALQARGATLRSGAGGDSVRQIETRAALKAYATPCASPDLATAAVRVRKAYDGYAQLRDMQFPGVLSSWQADRKPWPLVVQGKIQPGPRWRLWQTASGGAMMFGLTAGPGLVAVTASPAGSTPSGARLILRDPSKAPDAVIDLRRHDLQGRVPPRSATQVFLAQLIGPAPASLLSDGVRGKVMATFPPQTAAAMAALDPREAVTVELVFPTRTGERVQTAVVEVGDFAAARAFLAAGR